jgi:DNA-nicking Smr family endonuclease
MGSSRAVGGGSVIPTPPITEHDDAADELDSDVRLFREAVRDVRPLAFEEAPAFKRRAPEPVARFTRADRYAVLEESLSGVAGDTALSSGDELVYHRGGIQMSVLKKLRRGQYRVQSELDLHGLTGEEAKQALRDFLADSLERRFRCVRIIHGKGVRSGHQPPVLKNVVNSVLRRVGAVVAYVSARQVDGGTGAVYVLLAS